MHTIIILIERNIDGYWAYSLGNEYITGGGSTLKECKEDVLNCIETLKTFEEIPSCLGSPYTVVFFPRIIYHMNEEKIYCSAIWYKDLKLSNIRNPDNVDRGVVVIGHRHGDIIKNVYNLLGLRSVEKGKDSVGKYEQGFLTTKNRFVDRKEGAQIAFLQNQIKDLSTFNKDCLYSEDLY